MLTIAGAVPVNSGVHGTLNGPALEKYTLQFIASFSQKLKGLLLKAQLVKRKQLLLQSKLPPLPLSRAYFPANLFYLEKGYSAHGTPECVCVCEREILHTYVSV